MLKRVRVLSIVLSLIAVLFLSACTNSVEFTINFNSNGGSDVTSITTDGSSTINLPDDPTKDGYYFAGWYWDNNTFSNPFRVNSLLDSPISSNLTVYAKWVEQDDELTTQLKSIYLLATQVNAFQGTYEEWLETVRGPQGVPGEDGKSSLLRVNDGVLEWQLEGDTNWITLFDLSTLAGSDGIDGKNIVLQVSEGFIQWQYTGDTTWNNLIDLQTITGAGGTNGTDGKEVIFQVADGFIQWQYTGDTTWNNLIDLATITGADGTNGTDGVDGKEVLFQVANGYIQWQYVGETTWTNLIEIATITGNNGTDGVDGLTPFIGDNGNWWIGENDTGVYAGNQATIPQTGEFQYAVNSDGQSYVFIKYVGNDRYVRIPDYYNGYPVVAIAKNAFKNNTILETVILPNKLKIIEKYSFYGASSLTSIVIPNSVTSIGESAFYGTSRLTAIEIPNSVTSIGSSAFQSSGLQNITFEEGAQLISIGESAFYGTSRLTAIEIPNSVTSIGDSAFYGASSLTSIVIPNSVTSIGTSAFFEASSLTSIVIPNSVTSIGSYAFYGASSLTSIVIPNSVTSIGSFAFQSSGLQNITFEEGAQLTSIGDSAFSGASSLTSIVIPNSVTSIGSSAFTGASSLTSIVIPNSVTSIGSFAFNGARSLTSIVIPNSVTSIGSYAFYGASSLTSIVIPNSVTSIGDSAFRGASSLTSMTLPFVGQSRTATGSDAYFGYIFGKSSYTGSYSANGYYLPNSLTEVIITDATSIGSSAFFGASSLTSIVIPNSVTSIGSSAFYGASSLTSMTLPFVGQSRTATGTNAYFGYIFGKSSYTRSYSANGYYLPNSLTEVIITDATSIGSSAFFGASSLTSIVIPNSVTSIGDSAFLNKGLTIIYTSISSKPTNWNSNWVSNDVTVVWGYEQTVENDGLLYALSTKGVAYVIGTNESMTSNVVVLDYINGYEVIEIANSAFKDNLVIETIYIPNTIVKIGYQAFYGATNLTLVEFEVYSQLGYIDAYAFGNLSNLEAIIIPISVSTIKNNAFANTANLTINTYHEAKPSGWEDNWNPNNLNVVWSYNE